MSKWTTISTPDEHLTQFGVWHSDLEYFTGDTLKIEEGKRCYTPSDTDRVVFISINDTSNLGTIVDMKAQRSWGVILHSDSLWTFDVYPGPSYEYHEDMLDNTPEWAKVGGNWDWMD